MALDLSHAFAPHLTAHPPLIGTSSRASAPSALTGSPFDKP